MKKKSSKKVVEKKVAKPDKSKVKAKTKAAPEEKKKGKKVAKGYVCLYGVIPTTRGDRIGASIGPMDTLEKALETAKKRKLMVATITDDAAIKKIDKTGYPQGWDKDKKFWKMPFAGGPKYMIMHRLAKKGEIHYSRKNALAKYKELKEAAAK